MAIYMPPIARKKRVPEKYNPDSYRVISTDAETFHPKFPSSVIKPVYEPDTLPTRKLLPDIPVRKTRVLDKAISDFRANQPHPHSCGFLRSDVRLLNEPICTMHALDDQSNWWPNQTSNEPLHEPKHTLDSTYRSDFLYQPHDVPSGSNRHLANPNKEPALGSVPVNLLKGRDGKQRFYKEHISYEHEYNSRNDPNYPIRSKRHGAFVWKQLSPENRQKFIDYQEMMNQYESTVLNVQSEQPCDAPAEQREPEERSSPRQCDMSANNSVKSSASQMSLLCNKKMTPAATPVLAASPRLPAITDGIQQDSPAELIFYEQDVGTQTSPNNRNPSPSPKQLNVACDSTTEMYKSAGQGDEIPPKNE